jgi:hypothetical protein
MRSRTRCMPCVMACWSRRSNDLTSVGRRERDQPIRPSHTGILATVDPGSHRARSVKMDAGSALAFTSWRWKSRARAGKSKAPTETRRLIRERSARDYSAGSEHKQLEVTTLFRMSFSPIRNEQSRQQSIERFRRCATQ